MSYRSGSSWVTSRDDRVWVKPFDAEDDDGPACGVYGS